MNGKNAVFGNQIVKNESDYYFDVLTELFYAYRRAGYVNRKPSNWLNPENHENASKVLIMILHGLRALCKENYQHIIWSIFWSNSNLKIEDGQLVLGP